MWGDFYNVLKVKIDIHYHNPYNTILWQSHMTWDNVSPFLIIGLPVYISREEIFRELCHILSVANVPIEKKTEVINIIYKLQIKELCGNRKKIAEISACFKLIYPTIIKQLPSKELDLRDAAIQFLQNR